MTNQQSWHDYLALLSWGLLLLTLVMIVLGKLRGASVVLLLGVMCSIVAAIVRNPVWTPNELFWLVVRGVTLGIGVATLLWR